MAIRLYTSKHCGPCHQVEQLVKEGKFGGESEVEIVDIETDEGFAKFKEEVLDFGEGAVPSVYKEGKKCVISITQDNNLLLECPTNDPPSSDEG